MKELPSLMQETFGVTAAELTDRFVTLDKDYFIIPTAQGKMY